MNDVLKRIRKAIKDSGESQNSLARKKVAGQTTIGNWLNKDNANPRLDALARLVKLLRINGHWLLTDEGDMHALPASGGDELFNAGVKAGLARAEAAFRAVRANPSEDDDGGAAVGRAVRNAKKRLNILPEALEKEKKAKGKKAPKKKRAQSGQEPAPEQKPRDPGGPGA